MAKRNLAIGSVFSIALVNFACNGVFPQERLGNRLFETSAGVFVEQLGEGDQVLLINLIAVGELTENRLLFAQYETTVGLWNTVVSWPPVKVRLHRRSADPRLPVEFVSWYDAVEFCDRLTYRTGRQHRLPTEAEWERAAGGLSHEAILQEDVGNCGSRRRSSPVGSGKPNSFGLYDMLGNVAEWCLDSELQVRNGDLSLKGQPRRAVRGGSYAHRVELCRVTARDFLDPAVRAGSQGFRIVVAIGQP